MDIFRAVEVRALAAVEAQDGEWFYRHVCRWYSKTFNTPLPQVYDLSDIEIFQAYFEDRFETLIIGAGEEEAIKLSEIRQEMLETKDERFERELREAAGATDAEISHIRDQEMARMAWEADRVKKAKQALTIESISPKPQRALPEASLKEPTPLLTNMPPDIKMSFINEDEFENIVSELDGLSKPK